MALGAVDAPPAAHYTAPMPDTTFAHLSIEQWLQDRLSPCVHALLPAGATPPPIVVERSKPEFSSDFQSAVAMGLTRILRRPPKALAEELATRLRDALGADAETIDVSGPGFLGVRLSADCVSRLATRMYGDPYLGVARPTTPQRIVIDFSSPNVAKRMHIGHIRSTILGDALRRIGLFLGHEIIADNHIGDWGTQFGQLIHAYRSWRDEAAFEDDPVGELERLYVRFHQESAADPTLDDVAREELRKLQAGDVENRALWALFRERSQYAFDSIYERLGVRFDHSYGESHYHDALAPLVARLQEAGIAEPSEGAIVIFFRDPAGGDDMLPPFLIQKKDGAFLYATTDLATLEFRSKSWAPARVVYVTDVRQRLHFEQLFAAARRIGHQERLDHCWFGVMTLPEGMFSTRKGNVIPLETLLDEAERRAGDEIRARGAAHGEILDEGDVSALARVIGIGAVKYADLSRDPQSNIVFSFERMLSLEGNTAPYLQYTGARCASVARKAEAEGHRADGRTFAAESPEERDLVLHLFGLGRAATEAFELGKPSILAGFLYELAQKYHRFYTACPILRAERADLVSARLNLNALAARTLSTGLDKLGIDVPDRM